MTPQVRVKAHFKKKGKIYIKTYLRKKRPRLKRRIMGEPTRMIPITDAYGRRLGYKKIRK